MSEDFDKEAEREKLREQFREEAADREATQQMSDLLLRGATMTNRHCDVCGDPIFRYEGQEFCPSCQRTEDGAGDGATAEAAGETTADDAGDGAAAGAATGGDATDGVATGEAVGDETAPGDDSIGPVAQPSEPAATAPQSVDAAGGPSASAGDGDLDDARATLVRTLTRFAREAERTDDVGRARELLAATREAAEALSALDEPR